MQDFSNTRPSGLYEAAIGEKKQNYYIEKFEAFDEKGPDHTASWNWAAFLAGGAWALYRKMYGWFFVWWLLLTVVAVLQSIPNPGMHRWVAIFAAFLWLGFAVFANSLYHAKIRARIAAVTKSTSDASKVDKRLRAKNGVNAWVPIVFAAVPVLGIALAVALPTLNGAKGQAALIQQKTNPTMPSPSAAESESQASNQPTPSPTTFAEIKKLAEQGDANAQFNLGASYDEGKDVPKDELQAVFWYRQAAERGNLKGQTNLGAAYESGQGVAQDFGQALLWYLKAADQGHATAQSNIGRMYTEGLGVSKNDQQAVLWFRKGAERGDPMSQYNLGVMYFKGNGVSRDDELAYFWWLLSSARGNEDAVKMRNVAEKELTQAQRASAQSAARNWRSK